MEASRQCEKDKNEWRDLVNCKWLNFDSVIFTEAYTFWNCPPAFDLVYFPGNMRGICLYFGMYHSCEKQLIYLD